MYTCTCSFAAHCLGDHALRHPCLLSPLPRSIYLCPQVISCPHSSSHKWNQNSGGGIRGHLVPHLHFLSEEAGAQRVQATCPWSQRVLEAQQQVDPGLQSCSHARTGAHTHVGIWKHMQCNGVVETLAPRSHQEDPLPHSGSSCRGCFAPYITPSRAKPDVDKPSSCLPKLWLTVAQATACQIGEISRGM